MHFSNIATVAAIAGSALATTTTYPFSLKVKGGLKADDTYLSWQHESAAINYVFAGGEEPGYNFQLNGTVLSSSSWLGYPAGAYIDTSHGDPFLQIGVVTGEDGKFQNQYQLSAVDKELKFQGSDGWYACDNANDPYHYKQTAILFNADKKPDGDCEKVKLYAVFKDNNIIHSQPAPAPTKQCKQKAQ